MAQQDVLVKDSVETKIVAPQSDSSLYGLPYWLGIGEFFLTPENINKKYEGYWDYDKIYSLLKSWATEINPNLEENPSLSDIIKTLRDPQNANAIEKSNAVDPEQLKYLLEQLEKSKASKDEAAELAQKIKKAFMDSLVRESEIRNNYLKFSENALRNITASPIEPNQIEKVAQAISQNLIINETDIIAAIKAKDSTEPEAEESLLSRQREIWENAVVKATSRLKEAGLDLNQAQVEHLRSLPFDFVLDKIVEFQEKEAQAKAQNQTETKVEITENEARKIREQVIFAIKETLVPSGEDNKTEGTIEPLQRERVARAISESLEINQILTSPSPLLKQRDLWEATIEQAVVQLGKRGVRLNPEQILELKAIPPDAIFEQIAQAVNEEAVTTKQDRGILFKARIPDLDRKIAPLIEEVLKPTQSSRVKMVVAEVAPLVFVNTQPELGVNPKTASIKDIRNIQVKIQNEAVLSLSQIAPALVEKGIVLTPTETTKVLSAFSLTESETRSLLKTPFLAKSPLDKSPILHKKDAEQIQISQEVPIVNPHLSRVSPYNLRTESGKTLGRELKDILLTKGINRGSVSEISERIDRLTAIGVISAGLSPEILERSLQTRLKAGLPPNSSTAQEYKHLIGVTKKYLNEENPLLLRITNKNIKPGIYPLPRSENGIFVSIPRTVVDRNKPNVPAKPYINRILGGQRIQFVKNNLVIARNPINFIKTNVTSFAKNAFWKTGLGIVSGTSLQGRSQDVLQRLFSLKFSKEAASLPIRTNINNAFSRIGETSFSTGFLRPVGESLASVLSGQNKTINSISSVSQNLLASLSNLTQIKTNVGKWILYILIGSIGLFLLIILGTSSAFNLNQSGMGTDNPGSNPNTLPPECATARHFAEQLICTVSYSPSTDPTCTHHFVNRDTISDVSTCLFSSSITSNTLINGIFSQSVRSFGAIQCTAFTDAVQKALGKDMGNIRHACSYYTDPPSGYTLIQGTQKPQVGDVAVWNEGYCGGISKSTAAYYGHMAIVIAVSGNVKFTVAEANGITGEIRIVEYSFGNPDNDTDPSGFLR